MTSFEITSGVIRCTDPCYKGYEKGLQEEVKAKNGIWKYEIFCQTDGRVERLSVYNAEAGNSSTAFYNWELVGSCGVDSGQFGFFDASKIPTDPAEFEYNTGTFYGNICDGTLSDEQLGVTEFGVASSSGYGDGEYRVIAAKNKAGEVVALTAIFVDEADDEEEDWDEEDEENYDADDED